jgi:hypothetical protein
MERSQQFRGIDEEGVTRLALVLDQTAHDLAAARAALTTTLADVGRTATAPDQLRTIEAWLTDQATDIRRRSADASANANANAGTGTGVPLDHQVTAPVFHKDVLSGFHLQGFIGVGLGYRHLGQETRTVTDVFDCGDGLTSTVRTNEQRSVYEVWFGIGYGPVGWGTTDPYPAHDSWSAKKRTVAYARADRADDDGTQVEVRRPARTGPIGSGACPK